MKLKACSDYSNRWQWGIILRLESFWVGVHHSKANRRTCINVLPCVTLWITAPGGKVPSGPDYNSNKNNGWHLCPICNKPVPNGVGCVC